MVQRFKNESKSQPGQDGQLLVTDCFQWFKDTKMKANHNQWENANPSSYTVSNGSKILK